MTAQTSEKKVVNKTVAIALGIACIILAVGLVGAIANYTSIISGKDNIIATKDSQISDKDNTIFSLNSQVSSLSSQVSGLQNQVYTLQAVQLHRVEVAWSDNHPLFSSPYVNVHGSIFNSGSLTADNVVFTVRIYDASNTLLRTYTINVGDIVGKTYESFDVDITYSGDANSLTTELTYG